MNKSRFGWVEEMLQSDDAFALHLHLHLSPLTFAEAAEIEVVQTPGSRPIFPLPAPGLGTEKGTDSNEDNLFKKKRNERKDELNRTK